VISGFTSAVSLTIVATQIKALLGIHFEKEGFLPTMEGLAAHIGETKKGVKPYYIIYRAVTG